MACSNDWAETGLHSIVARATALSLILFKVYSLVFRYFFLTKTEAFTCFQYGVLATKYIIVNTKLFTTTE
ncbi:hypothetical protein VSU01S_40070 [Vibrio superstes NBRC 103154]|uniref:Uncharacterized protein n=1 Tax=Vibrio superstes NBRC 103154 TaxID=1219062 RepID=A0A511QZ04_9VIBR|nr:hypothetical protein VSU01S_40070 [Vibrio superstes NBRC 103154]